MVAGGTRSQATWWRKLGSKTDPITTQSGVKIPQKSRFLAAIDLAAKIDKEDIMDDASSLITIPKDNGSDVGVNFDNSHVEVTETMTRVIEGLQMRYLLHLP